MRIKRIIKEIVRPVLFVMKRKGYKLKIDDGLVMLDKIGKVNYNESFFGYYDHSPERNGKLLYHEPTKGAKEIQVVVEDKLSKERKVIGKSSAFNWQMGARAIWIDNDTVSYNDFDGKKYICKWYSLSRQRVIKTFGFPLQEYKGGESFLSINYQRLRSYAKEYAYYCLPELSDEKYDDYEHDGIWKVDVATGKAHLLLSIADVLSCGRKDEFDNGKHFVNHVMMAPNGYSFIFIHRYYVNSIRHDRLMYYDLTFQKLKVLMDDSCQSHYCWLDNDNIFGYGEFERKKGFFSINTNTGLVTKHEKLTSEHARDGHPTVFGDWIVIDNYPDLSRMQSLIAYNYKTQDIKWIGEFYHDLKHKEYNRCDLHPRFSEDGRTIWIDTVYSGNRTLMGLNISKLIGGGGGKMLILIDTLYKMYALKGEEEHLSRFLPLMKVSKDKNQLYRAIRKIHLSSPLPCKEIWFDNWTNILWEYDTVVLGETGNSYNVAKYIKKIHPSMRIIVWFRNSVSHTIKPQRLKKSICEVWSFDQEDCKKYELKYNPQFYYKTFDVGNKNNLVYDVFFIGRDKGRLQQILDIENTLKEQGLRTKFCIVGYNCSFMSYPEIIEHISKSKAILDIQGSWQKGITLRPLEALFYKKKLITNSREVENSDYYNVKNIKVVSNLEDLKGIKAFLDLPFVEIDAEIVNKYEYHSWLSRFKQ